MYCVIEEKVLLKYDMLGVLVQLVGGEGEQSKEHFFPQFLAITDQLQPSNCALFSAVIKA